MPLFRKTSVQEMSPWTPFTDMSGVSVTQVDKDNGSPKIGDMVAVSLHDPADKWLVSEQLFNDNYEPCY